MELLDVVARRRSIHSFTSEPVSKETLARLVEAARLAPSAANKNACRYLLVTQRETLDRLGETHRFCAWLGTASAAVAIVVDPAATQYWLEDSSVAAAFVWLAATDAGLGAAWGAMSQASDPSESQRRQDHVREVLSIPEGLYVPMVIGIGVPQELPPARTLPDLASMLFWERYPAAVTG